MAYQPISTVQNLGIQTLAEKRISDLKYKADQLAMKDKMDERTSNNIYTSLGNELYDMENATKDYRFLNPNGSMNIKSIKDNSIKYSNDKRKTILQEYRVKFEKAGLPFNASKFDESWQQGKTRENRRIINDLINAKSSGNISEQEFDMALNNNEFRNFYFSLRDEGNRMALTNAGYDPLYKSPKQEQEELVKLAKEQLNWENVRTKLGIFALKHPLGTAGIAGGAGLTGLALKKWLGGGGAKALSAAEQTLATAQEAWDTKGSQPKPFKRPKVKNFKGGGKSPDFIKALKKYTTRQKEISTFKTNKGNLSSNLHDARTAVDKLKSRPFKTKSLKLGRGLIPFGVGATYGGEFASGQAAQMGYGAKGQLAASFAGGTAGGITATMIAKRLLSPSVVRRLVPVIAKLNAGLAAKMMVSGGLAGTGVGTAVGLAGLAWTAWDIYQLSKQAPEIIRIIMEE